MSAGWGRYARRVVRVVFIDWYGVMSTSKFFQHWDVPGHPSHSDFAKLQEWWRGPEAADFFDEWGRGRASYRHFLGHMSTLLGAPEEWLEQEMKASIRCWQWVDPGILDQLEKLRDSGVRVVLATDTFDAFRLWVVEEMQVERHFDALLCSDELGYFKGDVKDGSLPFFQPWLEANQFRLDEAVLLDDSIDAIPHFALHDLKMIGVPHGTSCVPQLESLLAISPLHD